MATKTATKTATKSKSRARTTTKKSDPFKDAKRLIETIKESWFDFSLIVADIYENGPESWEAKGYTDFGHCASEEWGLEYKSAMNRVNAGLAIKKYGITKKMAKDTGWTNFMEISSLFNPEMKKTEINKMIKDAGKMTHKEVQKFKQETRMQRVGGEVQKRTKMTFTFLNEQADSILEILDFAKELTGADNEEAALEYALTEWRSMKKDSDRVKPSILKKLVGPVHAEEEEDEDKPKPKRKQRADAGKSRSKKKEEVEEEEEELEEEEDLLDDEEIEEEAELDEDDFDFEDED